MLKTKSFLLAVGVVLAMAFIFSCTSDIESAEEVLGKAESSSSSLQSSSVFCMSAVGCAEMSAEACSAFGGTIVSSCPVSSSSLLAVSSPSVQSSSSVAGPTNNCAYQASLCGGIAFDDIITKSFSNASLDEGPNCIFALGITRLGNENGQGGGLKVNGTKLAGQNNSDVGGRCGNTDWGQQPCTDAIRNIQKIDGGYYIYVPAFAGDVTTTGGNPNCTGGK
ncbi:MAG: hypothetical protein LBQ76_05190 [Candidatus Fibromonas sp.]|jgi:hypothetical protein|nr:hypothetical protein [Candidatus Fibromonas sp.]